MCMLWELCHENQVPNCHNDEHIEVATHDKLQKNSESVKWDKRITDTTWIPTHNELSCLDHAHAYYYQIQTQLLVIDTGYCDLCMPLFE